MRDNQQFITALTELHSRARAWDQRSKVKGLRELWPKSRTEAYIDLMFAYGLARLGAGLRASTLVQSADATLKDQDPVHRLLLEAFVFRIERARVGQWLEKFPSSWYQAIDEFVSANAVERSNRYLIDRLREKSRILEPVDKVDPYHYWKTTLPPAPNVSELQGKVDRFVKVALHGKRDVSELAYRLETASQRGDYLPPSVLEKLAAWVANLPPLPDLRELGHRYDADPRTQPSYNQKEKDRADLAVEYRSLDDMSSRARFLAAALEHCREQQTQYCLRQFVGSFRQMIEAQHGEHPHGDIYNVVPSALAALHRSGMPGEFEVFLSELELIILRGDDASLAAARSVRQQVFVLLMLQQVANGWIRRGHPARALPLMDAVVAFLAGNAQAHPVFLVQLAQCYIDGTCSLPSAQALERLTAMLDSIRPLNDTMTTNSHYSLARLQVIDTLVCGVLRFSFPDPPQADDCVTVKAI
jgi:hypothetical protein